MPAGKTVKINFDWDTGSGITITAKRNNEPMLTIIRADTNGCMSEVWGSISSVMQKYIRCLMDEIGKDVSQL